MIDVTITVAHLSPLLVLLPQLVLVEIVHAVIDGNRVDEYLDIFRRPCDQLCEQIAVRLVLQRLQGIR